MNLAIWSKYHQAEFVCQLRDDLSCARESLSPHVVGNMDIPSSQPLPPNHWIDKQYKLI